MGLGITQGFDPAGGMAVIVLDGTKYPGAANWSFFKGFPVPVVMALASSDDKALIQSLNGQPTEDPAVSSVTLQNEAVFAVSKDGYVLVGPDADDPQEPDRRGRGGDPAGQPPFSSPASSSTSPARTCTSTPTPSRCWRRTGRCSRA